LASYFEKLTLVSLLPALIDIARGRTVYYFDVGRVFLKLPAIGNLVLSLFRQTEYQVSEMPGMSCAINGTALETAEALHAQLLERNSIEAWLWRMAFPSDRIKLYIKKMIAVETWALIRDYLVLRHWVQNGHPDLRLTVQDSALNRQLVPFLQKEYPEAGIKISGLSHQPWRRLHHSIVIGIESMEFGIRILGNFIRRGFSFRSKKREFKLSKEIIWGVGTGRRTDHFMVDEKEILPEEFLVYYRKTSSRRMGNPNLLDQSISNAKTMGYHCVNFDKTPVSISLFWKVIIPRYMAFPLLMTLMAMLRSGAFFNHIILSFLNSSRNWEIFLASYAPKLNLSQDDPSYTHIADTIAMNLHGCQNGGFQWSDMTTYHAVSSAYLGYNVYFAWGPLPEQFWQGSWQVDQVFQTGYLWGHNYQESCEQRAALMPKILGGSYNPSRVVSLFDERPHRDVYQSNQMIFDFYRIGVRLIESDPNTIVIAKPKSSSGIPDIPEVFDLIAPYVESGRMRIFDQRIADIWAILSVSDATISLVMGTPFLEAMCCGRPGFSYAPTKNESSPIYTGSYKKAVFDDADDLIRAVNSVLDNPGSNPWSELQDLADSIDSYRDFKGADRMRKAINEVVRSEAK